MNLSIGGKLDAQYIDDTGSTYWYTASIVDIKSDQIKIHYQCDGENHEDDEWIEKGSKRLSLLNTHTLSITKLPSISTSYRWGSHAAYYQYNKNYYILLCVHSDGIIHRYDINASTWEQYTNYPDTFNGANAGNIGFDSKQLLLHIAYIDHDYLTKATLDILSKSWTLQTFAEKKIYASIVEEADLFYIPEPIQEIHLFFKTMHSRIIDDEMESERFKLEQTDDCFELNKKGLHKAIWCDTIQKLVTVHNGYIYHCHIKEKMQNKYVWECENDEKIDDEIDKSCHLVLAYQHILFVISKAFDKIFCVDLLYGMRYKILKEIPAILNHESLVIKTNDNYMHIIDSKSIIDVHVRVSLLEMIPQELTAYYKQNIYKPLVLGYIVKVTKDELLSISVPFDIANLILEFFPCFL